MSMNSLHATLGFLVVDLAAAATLPGPSIRWLWGIAILGSATTIAVHLMVVSQRGIWVADGPVARWSARLSSAGVVTVARYVTYLGSTIGVIIAALAVLIFEYRRGLGRFVAGYLTFATIVQALVVNATKAFLGRGRPQIAVLARTFSSSFPSGHTTAAATVYACIAFLMSRQRSVPVQFSMGALGVMLAVGVALTRVILGVHWLTDVTAGLALGWAIAAFCTLVFAKTLWLA
jgi:membrane-associated phospholipid phosphatase